MIHVNETIEAAWRQMLTEEAAASELLTEEAEISCAIDLAAEMGDAALDMLAKVLAGEFPGFTAWESDSDGNFYRDLDAIRLIYEPCRQQFVMRARLSEMISVKAQAAAEVCQETAGTIAFAAVGHFYDDGWKGCTEERALQDAQEQAEIRIEHALEELKKERRRQESESESELRVELEKEAEVKAQLQLEEKRHELRLQLRQQLQAELALQQQNAFYEINRAVGETYRQTLCRLVLDNGGRVINDSQSGSVIELELELC
jgi:Skp family chaperone for outer membrane proteins